MARIGVLFRCTKHICVKKTIRYVLVCLLLCARSGPLLKHYMVPWLTSLAEIVYFLPFGQHASIQNSLVLASYLLSTEVWDLFPEHYSSVERRLQSNLILCRWRRNNSKRTIHLPLCQLPMYTRITFWKAMGQKYGFGG